MSAATDLPNALKVSRVYRSVPESYRRLLPPEAFCVGAGLDPFRALELIAAGAARRTGHAAAIMATLWHPQLVLKTVERALPNGVTRERADDAPGDRVHSASGLTQLGDHGLCPRPRAVKLKIGASRPLPVPAVCGWQNQQPWRDATTVMVSESSG